MKARTKRRQRFLIGKDTSLLYSHFLKRHRQGYEIALYVRGREYEAEIWRRVDETGELWERLSRQPIDGPLDRRAVVRYLKQELP